MDKDVVHTYNIILLSHWKKNENNAICSNTDGTQMDQEIIILRQSDRERQNIIYMWNLKIHTNELIYQIIK